MKSIVNRFSKEKTKASQFMMRNITDLGLDPLGQVLFVPDGIRQASKPFYLLC